jgi:hypothetical protein
MYSSKPTPPQNSAISHTTRMRVGSTSKYSANPAQTPPSFLSLLERIKRLTGAGAALATPGCPAPHAEQNLDPSGISFAQFTQYIFHPPAGNIPSDSTHKYGKREQKVSGIGHQMG